MSIDDTAYIDGRKAFSTGTSLRDIAERIMRLDAVTDADEAREMSFALGYADAALNALRASLMVRGIAP